MPATDYLMTSSSSVPFATFSRKVFTLHRHQSFSFDVHLAAGNHDEIIDFQANVADLLGDLAAASDEEILSILWVRKLLDTFLVCLEEFRGLMSNRRRAGVSQALRESLLGDFLDRALKALDFCNAACDGVEVLRQSGRHLETVLAALGGDSGGRPALNERRVLRAKKAIADLASLLFDDDKDEEKDVLSLVLFHRNRGNPSSTDGGHGHQSRPCYRVAPSSWSAARQLQAIGSNIVPPRSQDIVSTSGLAVAVYTMNSILFFVMWVLVAAFPCQDRGLHVHFSVPNTYVWAAPAMSLYDRILEESKKKDHRRNSKGLLREILHMEKVWHQLSEPLNFVQYRATAEKEAEIRQGLEELSQVSTVLKDWLDPMESHIREVFRRISRCRIEGFDHL